jgi:hypothetical protein
MSETLLELISRPCSFCKHTSLEHRVKPGKSVHGPYAQFHCEHDDCDCVVVYGNRPE